VGGEGEEVGQLSPCQKHEELCLIELIVYVITGRCSETAGKEWIMEQAISGRGMDILRFKHNNGGGRPCGTYGGLGRCLRVLVDKPEERQNTTWKT
jgi:hypothetical protein